MNRFLLSIVFLNLSLSACFAGETNPVCVIVKPYLHSFTHARVDLRRDTVIYKQEKVIFGLDIKMNENWLAKVGVDLIDMNKPYLKPTVLTFRKNRWTLDGGIFYTSELDKAMSQFWGNRFIDRVAVDKWMLLYSADLGVRATYRWSDFVITDVSIVSGNGYQHLRERYHPKPAFRAIITPFRSFQLGGYIAARKGEGVVETTFSSFAHLQMGDKWKATGEYHRQTDCRLANGHTLDVMSVYGTYYLMSWMGVMGRYDLIRSNKVEPSGENWNVSNDGQAFIGGLIFRCFPTVRVSVNYWNKRPSTRQKNKEDWLYLCLEFRY